MYPSMALTPARTSERSSRSLVPFNIIQAKAHRKKNNANKEYFVLIFL
jgi:hypothetical protein